jgi:hypothetical protein
VSNAIRALMVTFDGSLATNFAQISREVGMETQASVSTVGIPEELSNAKYEAVLLDFDTVPDAMPILSALRRNRSNQKAVVFAVASETAQGKMVLDSGANLLLERPVENAQIRRVLHAAYDLMVRERRRYFRCTVELPVVLTQAGSGASFSCTSMNMSSNGMAVRGPGRFVPGEPLEIIVPLRDPEVTIRAMGTVVWDDKHGKTGIAFQCTSSEHQKDLDGWLDQQLAIALRCESPDHQT